MVRQWFPDSTNHILFGMGTLDVQELRYFDLRRRGPMIRRGQCWDKAPTESLFRTFKRETRSRKLNSNGLGEAEVLVFDWIETWYNLRRKHTFTGYISPVEFEMRKAA
jgi:transposase InsO family protein